MLSQNSTNSIISCTTLSAFLWQDWTACSYADELAVFRFEWPHPMAIVELFRELTAAEIDRAKRFRRLDDQFRFAYGRCILRRLLEHYVGRPYASIELTEGMNRKPILANASGWHFNISHSGNWILVAVSNRWVGVDLERVIADFNFQDIIYQSFSESEQQFVDKSLNCVEAFYTLWTRKEALVKATAKGVDEDFALIPSLDGSHTVDSLAIGASGNWLVNSFWVGEGYPAAVAYPAMSKVPQFYTLDRRFFELG